MHLLIAPCLLVASYLVAPLAWSAAWFELETEDGISTLEVDVTSLRWRGEHRELKVRISHPEIARQGLGPGYKSVLATLEVQCDSGQSIWRSISFHPDGSVNDRAQATHAQETRSVIRQIQTLISEKTWVTLRRSACIQPRLLQ